MEPEDNIVFKNDIESKMPYAVFQELDGAACLQKYIKGKNILFIKGRFFDDKGQAEHMWMKFSKYDEDKDEYFGILDNTPFVIKNFKLNDVVSLKRKDICNFAFEEGNKRITFLPLT